MRTYDRRPMRAERTIPYQPALDGVRALAVIAVLLFHGGVSWMTGGYLGVSVFFTLSGFLITSLLVRETATTGRVDAGRFYARRARRLLPASLLCIAAVCLLAAGGAFKGVSGLRSDVLGALLQVFNWVKLGSGQSYADLTTAASGLRRPLDHYWSLSIEEQFYWVWPVAVLGLLRLARRRPRWTLLRSLIVLYVLTALAAPIIAWQWGPDAAYWATPARASEMVAGALLAVWWSARGSQPVVPSTAARQLGWLGGALPRGARHRLRDVPRRQRPRLSRRAAVGRPAERWPDPRAAVHGSAAPGAVGSSVGGGRAGELRPVPVPLADLRARRPPALGAAVLDLAGDQAGDHRRRHGGVLRARRTTDPPRRAHPGATHARARARGDGARCRAGRRRAAAGAVLCRRRRGRPGGRHRHRARRATGRPADRRVHRARRLDVDDQRAVDGADRRPTGPECDLGGGRPRDDERRDADDRSA